MQNKVFSYIEGQQMLTPGMEVLVGFSGGADSTALLLLLKEYGDKHRIGVRAVHVHHGIRGESADRDQVFCAKFCQERGIPLRIYRRDVPAYALTHHMSLEEAGREVRYEIFRCCLEDGFGERVALAHHQNDQAETMLFRLSRGTGLKGLGGMEPVRFPYIRPLLCVTRQEVMDWLRARHISWMEDESNQEVDYARNRIRKEILAPMEAAWPGTVGRLAGTAERIRETENYLEYETGRAWKRYARETADGYAIGLQAFTELHPAMQKLIIRKGMELLTGGKNLEAGHVEQLLKLVHGKRGGRTDLPGHVYGQLGYEELLLRKKVAGKTEDLPEIPVKNGENTFAGQIFLVTVEDAAENEKIPTKRYTKWFDYDRIKQGMVLRNRKPGDYLANGAGSHKKLKDYFIDQKVPREDRDRMILLADGNHIMWAVGMRISEEYKVTEQTKRILKIHMKNMEE